MKKTKHLRKTVEYNGRLYVLEFKKGAIQNTPEYNEFVRDCESNIQKIASKYSKSWGVDKDEVVQLMWLIQMCMLETWSPARSPWNAYWTRFAKLSLIDELRRGNHKLPDFISTDADYIDATGKSIWEVDDGHE